jgi:hypothetical protein
MKHDMTIKECNKYAEDVLKDKYIPYIEMPDGSKWVSLVWYKQQIAKMKSKEG